MIARAGCQLAWLDAQGGDARAAEARLEEAEAELARSGDPIADLLISSLRGQLLLQRGHLAKARRRFERARALSVRIGDRSNEASAAGFMGVVAYDEGLPSEAVGHYDRAVAIAEASGASIMEAVFRGYRGIAQQRMGDDRAEASYREAVACADRAGAPRFAALFEAWRGALLAERGDVAEAEAVIDRADALPDARGRVVFLLHRGHLDLARADAAWAAGEAAAALRHYARACRRLAAGRAEVGRLRELRVVSDHLATALSRRSFVTSARLLVGHEARWFVLDGETHDLSRRGPLRRLLWALTLTRIIEPGVAASAASLVEATWPGEVMRAGSATHRLHVTLSSLRRLGLRDELASSTGGYHLSEGLGVALAAADQTLVKVGQATDRSGISDPET